MTIFRKLGLTAIILMLRTALWGMIDKRMEE